MLFDQILQRLSRCSTVALVADRVAEILDFATDLATQGGLGFPFQLRSPG